MKRRQHPTNHHASPHQHPGPTQPPPRPIAIIKGWRSLEHNAQLVARKLHRLTPHNPGTTLLCSFDSHHGIPAIAEQTARRIAEAWPQLHATHRNTIDAIGISMGGLIARHIAAHRLHAPGHTNPLRIHTLYTLATPHRGARLARFFHILDTATAQMRPNSAYLARLDNALANPERRPLRIITFSRTRDWWVGTRNAALPNHIASELPCHHAHTVPAPPLTFAHLLVARDKRIPTLIADDINARAPTPSPQLSSSP